MENKIPGKLFDKKILESHVEWRRQTRDIDIEDYLADMFVTPDQFVVLSAPKAQNNIRFVQACTHDGEIEVELGIEEKGTRLYYKMCTQEECYRIFLDFLW